MWILISVYGDASADVLKFRAIEKNTWDEYPLVEQLTFNVNQMIGTISSPLKLSGLKTITGFEDQLNEVLIFPNPFKTNFEFDIPFVSETAPRVILTDVVGKQIDELEVQRSAKGWSGAMNETQIQLKAGVYLLNVYNEGKVNAFRIIKEN